MFSSSSEMQMLDFIIFSIHLRIIHEEETSNYGCLFLLLMLLGSSFEEERGENFVLMCGI